MVYCVCPVKRSTLQNTPPGVAGSFRNHPPAPPLQRAAAWGEVAVGIRLTRTQCSPSLGGLWVAEWSTWRTPASPFYSPPSPSQGTQSRHCVGNDCALKMEPADVQGKHARPCRRHIPSPPRFSAADPCESVSILVFAAKSHQITFLGRVGGAAQNEIPTESRRRQCHPPVPELM